ncbi:MAG: hypothetical protein H0U27_09865 [Nitrosopumilus sp.]|nr:hypothetical protein [Nitrosopumilus sp.]
MNISDLGFRKHLYITIKDEDDDDFEVQEEYNAPREYDFEVHEEYNPPRGFKELIERHLQKYQEAEKEFTDNITIGDLYKRIVKLEAKVAELTESH